MEINNIIRRTNAREYLIVEIDVEMGFRNVSVVTVAPDETDEFLGSYSLNEDPYPVMSAHGIKRETKIMSMEPGDTIDTTDGLIITRLS